MPRLPAIVCIAALGVAGNVESQQPAAPAGITIAPAPTLAVLDGAPCAMGPGYKATFRDGAFEFVPALGDRVERNHRFEFALETIHRGATLVYAADGPMPEPRLDGLTVLVPRGSVAERYDARADGIEQSFVFGEPIPGEGDLVVTGRVTTTLPAHTTRNGATTFEVPGVGGVRIGEVVGVDASGRRVPGTARLSGDRFVLSLPAAFVATARWPLVLDPLIGTTIAVAGADTSQADCAYDHDTRHWLVVWQQRFSLTDVDLWAARIDADTGTLVGAPVIVDNSADACTRPRVAGIAGSERFLIVYQQGASPFGPWEVRARSLLAASGFVSQSLLVASVVGQEPLPVVGGEADEFRDGGLVVWENDGIKACKVTVPLTTIPTAGPIVDVTTSTLAHQPAISRTGGAAGRLLVVWTETAFSGDQDLYARLVSRDGLLLTGVTPLATSSADDSQPAVDGDGTDFVVAHSRVEPTGALRDVRCLPVHYAGLLAVGVDLPIEATPNEDEFGPDIAWLGPKYCVTFVERPTSFQDDVGAWLVDSTCTTCNARITLPGLDPTADSTREWAPRVAGRWAYAQNGFDDGGLIVFTESRFAPPFTGTIAAQRLEALGPGTAPVSLGGGCGNGGTGSVSAPFVVGSSGFHFLATGLDPAAIVVLDLGFSGPPIGCGTCSLVAPVVLELKANVGGTASSPFAVPCDPGFAGLVIEFQWLSLLPTVGSCPLVEGMVASDRVQLTAGN